MKKTTSNQQLYKCDECDESFSLIETLTHRRKHKKFLCIKCPFKSTNRETLTDHMEFVHMKLQLPCNKCDYIASHSSGLKIHYQSEHVLKYPCGKCDLELSSSAQLKEHRKFFHKLDTSYFCNICDYTNKRKYRLRWHEESVHYGIRYPCHECDYKATREDHLKAHQKTVHKIKLE